MFGPTFPFTYADVFLNHWFATTRSSPLSGTARGGYLEVRSAARHKQQATEQLRQQAIPTNITLNFEPDLHQHDPHPWRHRQGGVLGGCVPPRAYLFSLWYTRLTTSLNQSRTGAQATERLPDTQRADLVLSGRKRIFLCKVSWRWSLG